jgi:hypothetical protein
MKVPAILASGALALLAWLLPGLAAAGEVVPDPTDFLSGTQVFVDTFDAPAAGILTLTPTRTGWPADLQMLGAYVSSSAGIVVTDFGPGSESVVVGPGEVSVHWFGTGAGALSNGQYGLQIQFQPACVAAVPLPQSLVVFASGLLLLAFLVRRQRRGLPWR